MKKKEGSDPRSEGQPHFSLKAAVVFVTVDHTTYFAVQVDASGSMNSIIPGVLPSIVMLYDHYHIWVIRQPSRVLEAIRKHAIDLDDCSWYPAVS